MPVQDYTPSLADVGQQSFARTKDEPGNYLGTFTEDTTPTDVVVEGYIEKAISNVTAKTGIDIPEELWGQAKSVISIRAAMYIELGVFPEQIRTDRSHYEHLRDLFKEEMKDLLEALSEAESEDGEIGPGSGSNMPSFSFPANDGGMVGWGTNW